jgi:hypothetical protein
MSADADSRWSEANQGYLGAALSEVRAVLEQRFATDDAVAQSSDRATTDDGADWQLEAPPALEAVCSAFELSGFERKVLLLCAGAEMDSRFASLFAAAHADARRTLPTFSLALGLFDDAHWSALSPARPLRRWQLVEVIGGDTLTASPLRIQERVLHFLAGVHCLDERLQPLVKPVPRPDRLAVSHRKAAEQLAAVWAAARDAATLPVVELCGDEPANKRPLAAAACALLGLRLHAVAAWSLPQSAAEVETFQRLWEREAVLSSSALLLECDDSEGPESALASLVESLRGPLIVATRGPQRCARRAVARFDVANPTESEQAELWRGALPTSLPELNGKVDDLASQFNLSPSAIGAAAGRVARTLQIDAIPGEADLGERLWDACRMQVRPRLDGVAQRIEAAAGWDDLVLPESQKQVLGQIAVHVRQRAKVYQAWGFAGKGSRGLGISALFAGPSGTGKTMAAEVLAGQLRLDLYRIDLSQVVSKYIGETEKNLRRVFDAAEEGAAVLLFDEADALFGKRTEVKDSHDRYANIEVSYLLQRMEAYRGLAILTTNRKSALDQAFLRRLRFVVEFPFPDGPQRAEIWRRVFPSLTPTENLRIDLLARLSVAGGNIRNIALGAAFLAADAGEPVRMTHLLAAARGEFAKLEKPLADAEIAGWV